MRIYKNRRVKVAVLSRYDPEIVLQATVEKDLRNQIRKELIAKSMRAVKPIVFKSGYTQDDFITNMYTTVAQTFGMKVPRIFGLNYKR